MATVNLTHDLPGPARVIKKASGWVIAMAVVFIILGVIALAESGIAGLAVTILVGWLLIIGGVTHLIAAFRGRGFGAAVWQVFVGAIYILGGFYFLTHPVLGLGTLTLVLAGIIVAEGVMEFFAYFQTRTAGGSVWLLINGLVTLFLGGLIWFHWPSSSVWAIGTLVGVNLLMTGVSRLALGLTARKLASRVAE